MLLVKKSNKNLVSERTQLFYKESNRANPYYSHIMAIGLSKWTQFTWIGEDPFYSGTGCKDISLITPMTTKTTPTYPQVEERRFFPFAFMDGPL